MYGGFHHKMWRLNTDSGSYAIKQLAVDVDLGCTETTSQYNVTESIAERFSECGIPAIFALKQQANYLQIVGGAGYLVYPWTDAVALGRHEITAVHAIMVAGILAKMHRANIVVPELKETPPDFHAEEKMILLVNRAQECNIRNANTLSEQLPYFLRIVASHKTAIGDLENSLVISHGDLDHKNVLWSAVGDPLLIDWESARRLNPTYEIVLEALDWSGITSTFQHGLFTEIISAYKRAGGVIDGDSLQASFHCILGDWLNWLMFNVGRTVDLEDAEQRLIGTEQVDLALATILRLERQLPNLMSTAAA